MEIRKEVPSGDINGVNKIFTLANDVDYIDDIFVDGVIYEDYILVGRVLTFVDAPQLSVYVDYKTTAPVPTIPTLGKTLGSIITEIYRLTGQTSNSVKFGRSVLVDEINSICNQIWDGRVTNILNPRQIFRCAKQPYQKAYIGYRLKGSGTITVDAVIGDTVVKMDAKKMAENGYAVLGSDYIKYTSKTDTQLNGVSGITTDHFVGENVSQLYQTPAYFYKADTVYKISKGTYQATKIEIPYGEENIINYTQISYDETTLLKIDGLEYGDEIRVDYITEYIPMIDDANMCMFPDNYGTTVVAKIVAGQLMYSFSMQNGERVLNNGYINLQNMYGNVSNSINKVKTSIKPIFRRRFI